MFKKVWVKPTLTPTRTFVYIKRLGVASLVFLIILAGLRITGLYDVIGEKYCEDILERKHREHHMNLIHHVHKEHTKLTETVKSQTEDLVLKVHNLEQ